jgi:hypothetical protein
MQAAEIRPLGNCRVSCSLFDTMAARRLEETSTDKTRTSRLNSCWLNRTPTLTSGTNEPGIPEWSPSV